MIIEAGYELWVLIAPQLTRNAESKQELWLLQLDRDLRYSGSTCIAKQMGPSILPHVASTIDALDEKYGHYFAIAHWADQTRYGECGDFEPDDAVLREAAEARGFELIGHLVMNDDYWYSSGPMYSFRDYPGEVHLPRALVLRGPHPMFECRCAACVDFERTLAAGRATNRPTIEPPP